MRRSVATRSRRGVLLQQVLSIDGDNELALMWMASVVDTLNERRFYLERALQVNPDNTRAREALRRLGVEGRPHRRAPAPAAPATTCRVLSGGTTNIYLIAAAVVAFVVVAVVVAAVVSSLNAADPAPPTPDVQARSPRLSPTRPLHRRWILARQPQPCCRASSSRSTRTRSRRCRRPSRRRSPHCRRDAVADGDAAAA